jgi:hypothetical protein
MYVGAGEGEERRAHGRVDGHWQKLRPPYVLQIPSLRDSVRGQVWKTRPRKYRQRVSALVSLTEKAEHHQLSVNVPAHVADHCA